MGNRPGWTKAWIFDSSNDTARHESGATFRRPMPPKHVVDLVAGTDATIQAIGATAAEQVLKRLRKEAGDLFRKTPRVSPPSFAPAAPDPGGLSLRVVLETADPIAQSPEGFADEWLRKRDYEKAEDQYRTLGPATTTRVAEKRGLCLMNLGRYDEAIELLSPLEPSLSSTGLSALGWALCQGDLGTVYKLEDATQARIAVVASAIPTRDPIPSSTALYFTITRSPWSEAGTAAVRLALEHYPRWPFGLMHGAAQHRKLGLSASEIYERANTAATTIESAKQWVQLRWECARVAYAADRIADAIPHVQVILDLDQGAAYGEAWARTGVLMALTTLCVAADKWGDAEPLYERFVAERTHLESCLAGYVLPRVEN